MATPKNLSGYLESLRKRAEAELKNGREDQV